MSIQLYWVQTLGWRSPPTDNSSLGSVAKGGEPDVEQIFVCAASASITQQSVELRVYIARKRTEAIAAKDPERYGDLYMVSLSTRTVCYKGQFLPEQVFQYYLDLQHPAFESHVETPRRKQGVWKEYTY